MTVRDLRHNRGEEAGGGAKERAASRTRGDSSVEWTGERSGRRVKQGSSEARVKDAKSGPADSSGNRFDDFLG